MIDVCVSLAQIREWKGFGETDAVEEQAEYYGIAEDSPVWRLTLIGIDAIRYWPELAGAPEEESLAKVTAMTEAYFTGRWLPPIIVVALAEPDDDGHRYLPLDGWHRCHAALLARREAVPAWVAAEK